MKFTLISAQKKVLEREGVSIVSLPAKGGLMEVRPNHKPFVVAIEPGVLWITDDTGITSFAIGMGLLETDGKNTLVFADTIESSADLAHIDLQQKKNEARKIMLDLQQEGIQDPEKLLEAEVNLLREEARIKVKMP